MGLTAASVQSEDQGQHLGHKRHLWITINMCIFCPELWHQHLQGAHQFGLNHLKLCTVLSLLRMRQLFGILSSCADRS